MTALEAEGVATGALHFLVEPDGSAAERLIEIAVAAGYTGRDREAVLAHIAELEAEGVAPPPEVPCYYAIAPQLVTQGDLLVTTEAGTSGEAEVVLVVSGDDVLVTLGSDHTDRQAERVDIPLSKRACHKVVSHAAWRLAEIVDHWDELRLSSWIGDDADEPYQSGTLAALLTPEQLLPMIPWRSAPDRYLVFCGTVPTIGGMRDSSRFRAELLDPVTGRCLEISYRVEVRDMLRTSTVAPKDPITRSEEP